MIQEEEKYKVANKSLEYYNDVIHIVLWLTLFMAITTGDDSKAILTVLFLIYRKL